MSRNISLKIARVASFGVSRRKENVKKILTKIVASFPALWTFKLETPVWSLSVDRKSLLHNFPLLPGSYDACTFCLDPEEKGSRRGGGESWWSDTKIIENLKMRNLIGLILEKLVDKIPITPIVSESPNNPFNGWKFPVFSISQETKTNFFCWTLQRDNLVPSREYLESSIFLLSPFEITINKRLFLEQLNRCRNLT